MQATPACRQFCSRSLGCARSLQLSKHARVEPHAVLMQNAEAAAWACVLRRATPRTLAVVACVCRGLRDAATQLRACDVACGTEGVVVLAPSAADAAALRAQFQYTPWCTGAASEAEEDLTGGGCSCVGAVCDPAGCSCAHVGGGVDALPLVECGPACGCGAACANRVTQQRVSVPLLLRRTDERGWGVVADAPLPAGRFMCTYAGELLSVEEARRRLAAQDAAGARCNYVLLVREHAGDRTWTTCLDPTRAGNVGRFLNHACDGGCLELRAVRSAGWPVPRAAFFTRRRVQPGEELTWSYGDTVAGAGTRSAAPCHCGTPACTGRLPFDDS